MLRRCPAVRVVATSREPLGLTGEHVWRVPPLAAAGAATELFLERAGVAADDGTIPQLCGMLDGLPLAIELAAARADAIPPAEIVAQLHRRPNLLRSRDPSVAPRQRSILDLVDWSVRLLDVDERVVYVALGGFGGSFDLAGAAAAVGERAGLDANDVADAVWSLVSKSLVATAPATGASRYYLLETIRADARRRLQESGQAGDVATRIGHHILESLGDIAAVTRTGRTPACSWRWTRSVLRWRRSRPVKMSWPSGWRGRC